MKFPINVIVSDDSYFYLFGVFCSRHPEVKWAETTDKIFLTVVLADSKETKVNLDAEGVFDFSAKAGHENHVYELKLELHDKVNVEECKINIGVRSIFSLRGGTSWSVEGKRRTMLRLIGISG
ncbi:hypothetical protein BRARA_I00158 [Brassica rapa]|uniref:Co-chaperone protein p23 n=1 Tax=Brassica campestris TaxID=3711 RepID=A0A397XQ21_BRACM|nr:hypothetical protein BRARA_I00158 [Brassica rapa]